MIVLLGFRYLPHYCYGSLGTKDFLGYWGSGQLMRAGESPYDFVKLRQLQSKLASSLELPVVMWNPPWILVWLYPVLLWPFPMAALLWLGLNYALILASATVLWRLQAGPSNPRWVGIAWVASLAFVPTLHVLYMGQVSSLLLLGIVGFLYASARGWDFLAGVSLALTTIKPHVVYLLWIAFLWWVIVERRWRYLAGVGTSLLAALGLLAVYWPASLWGYRTVLSQPPIFYKTPTLGGVLRLWLSPEDPWIQFLVSSIVGGTFLAYLLLRHRGLNWGAVLAPILLISVPTASYGYTFDQIVLLVPYLAVVGRIAERSPFDGGKTLLLVALLMINGMMAAQGLLRMDYWLSFWAPWALALVFWYSQRRPSASAARDLLPEPNGDR
jgi:hypothetical protein